MLAAGANDFLNTTVLTGKNRFLWRLPPLEAWLQGYTALVGQVRGSRGGVATAGGLAAAGEGEACMCGHAAAQQHRPSPATALPLPLAPLPAQIRRMYPQAAIVQLVWPQEALLAGLLEPQQSVPYQKYMAAGFQRLQALGAQGVHLLQLSGTEVKRERWDW